MHPLSRKLIDRSPAFLRRPVAVIVRTADAAMADRLPGLAAEVAFWTLLSLPALLVAALATFGLLGSLDGADWQDQLVARVVEVSRVALTQTTIDRLVEPVLRQLFDATSTGLVSLAFVTAVWTASRAVKVVLVTVTLVYDREGMRRGWVDRFLGFGITIGALVVGAVIAPLLLTGPDFGAQIETWTGQDLGPFASIWRSVYWPTVVLLATIALATLYHLATPGRTRWQRDLPGAILATSIWLAGSWGLRLYGAFVATTGSAYGPLAGPIVALLWMWVTALAVLAGAEFNAQVHRLSLEEPGRTAPAMADPGIAPAPQDVNPTADPQRVRRS